MTTFRSLALALLVTAWVSSPVASQSTSPNPATKPTYEVVLTSDVTWEQLNPLRGDQSPKAGTLWGDRTGPGPAGFLLKPADGFRSPPHIHNIAYRGVVIGGLIHNDDPDADDMWMPAGSFWTQPEGGVHITAARGRDTLAYIEVEDGFGVLPADKAFRSKDQPINVDASNIVWLDASNTVWIDRRGMPASAKGPEVAFLWGNPRKDQLNGTLVKLPAGFTGRIRSQGSTFRAVVIKGRPNHREAGGADVKAMEPGSYFASTGESVHQVSCGVGEECIVYVRMVGTLDVIPVKPKN